MHDPGCYEGMEGDIHPGLPTIARPKGGLARHNPPSGTTRRRVKANPPYGSYPRRVHPDPVDAGARRDVERLLVGVAEAHIGGLFRRPDGAEVLAFG